MRLTLVVALLVTLGAATAHADTPAQILDRVAAAPDDAKVAARAIADLDAYIEAHPDDAEGPMTRAKIQSHVGKKEDAAASYELALRIDPKTPDADYNLAVVLLDLGREADAVKHLEAAVVVNPKDVDAYYNLGQVHYNHQRYAKALAAWQKSLALAPGDFTSAKKIVQAYSGLGRDKDAAKARAVVVKLWKDSKDPGVQKLTEYVIDQFVVGDHAVMAYEPLPGNGAPVVFRFTVHGAGGAVTDAFAIEQAGKGYVVSRTRADGTRTELKVKLGKKLPGWKKLRATMQRAMRTALDAAP